MRPNDGIYGFASFLDQYELYCHCCYVGSLAGAWNMMYLNFFQIFRNEVVHAQVRSLGITYHLCTTMPFVPTPMVLLVTADDD